MKRLLDSLIYIVVTFVLLEIVLRVCFPIPEYSNFNRINYQILDRTDNKQGYLRNIEMLWKSTLDTNYAFVHEFNQYGFRDNLEWKSAKTKGEKRILFVGDSFVEGMMSTTEKTIPNAFSSLAEERGEKLEVFNCGMMGIGLNEYMKFIKDAIPLYKPDEVIMVLYSNDLPFQRDYVPQAVLEPVENNLFDFRFLKIIEQIKTEDPIPFKFKPERRPFYKAVPDVGNPWTTNETLLKTEVTPVIADAMKKGDFNYFRTNWILEEEKFLKASINIESKLRFIRDYLKKYNTNLTIFYIPSRSQVSNYYYQFEKQACVTKCPDYIDLTTPVYQKHAKIIAQDCKKLEIGYLDFTELIRAKESSRNHLYWNYDDHMRGNSYVMLGREMYNFWKSNATE
ncbi:SGNH/GDSL hydrolase family protein [Aquimarina sp. 2201CG14-23]|uniref:SGNH/GDSL hydrolase family protein n=1 Tax=Aquimarina mycalae TaxID=3040073 RepID=UPI00247801D7|nr:SGNH/GDSL hydrolase family protein [Aquimarina sp. 2201CG14-23]MDH7445161.1 SGNH/GDSL hydrolase family protein [Aquimarina sp. 2201CG14-23]